MKILHTQKSDSHLPQKSIHPGLLFSGVRTLRLSDSHVKSLRAYGLFPIGTVEYSSSLAVEKNTNAAIQAKRPERPKYLSPAETSAVRRRRTALGMSLTQPTSPSPHPAGTRLPGARREKYCVVLQ
ncbi:MAG: hypothetical protein K9M57_03545 [Phycisphaerae bacterium]|nr:hypothetical protein [Phycisphaerae bacterium]